MTILLDKTDVGELATKRTACIRIPPMRTLDDYTRWIFSGGRPPHCESSFFRDKLWLNLGNCHPELFIPALGSYRDFRRWVLSEDFPTFGRFSWLSGELEVDMSPEEIETHNKCKGRVHSDLDFIVREEDLGDVLADRVFLLADDFWQGTEPDIMFVSYESQRTGRVEFVEYVDGSDRYVAIKGAVDLIVEIVSLSSVRKDKVDLPELYYKSGALEFWIIDARRQEIEFVLLVRGESEFEPVEPDEDGFYFSTALNRSVRVTRAINQVGRFQYALESR